MRESGKGSERRPRRKAPRHRLRVRRPSALVSPQQKQFVLNSAREKRDMEQRHAAIKKKVSPPTHPAAPKGKTSPRRRSTRKRGGVRHELLAVEVARRRFAVPASFFSERKSSLRRRKKAHRGGLFLSPGRFLRRLHDGLQSGRRRRHRHGGLPLQTGQQRLQDLEQVPRDPSRKKPQNRTLSRVFFCALTVCSPQALVLHSEKSAGVSEEIEGKVPKGGGPKRSRGFERVLCPSGAAHGGGGGPAPVHGQAQRRERQALLFRSGLPVQVSPGRRHGRAAVARPQLTPAQELSVAGRLGEAAAGVDRRRAEQHRLGLPRAPTQSGEDARGGGRRRRRGLRHASLPLPVSLSRRGSAATRRRRAAPSTVGRARARRPWSGCGPSPGTGGAATAGRRVPTGLPSTWASRCASCAREYTGRRRASSRASNGLTRRQCPLFQEPGGPLLQSALPDAGFLGAGTHQGNARFLLRRWQKADGRGLILSFSQLMCELGNGVINGIYEARIDEITFKKPLASSPR